MWFCPLDGTLLLIGSRTGDGDSNTNHFYCSTCPYSCSIAPPPTQQQQQGGGRFGGGSGTNVMKSSISTKIYNTIQQTKQVDDILGGVAAWENVDRTMSVCPICNYHEAYFLQMQIRSADEPMSIFYKCVKCNHQWNDK